MPRFVIILLLCLLFVADIAYSQMVTPLYEYGSQRYNKSFDLYDDGLLYFTRNQIRTSLEKYPDNAYRDKAELLLADVDLLEANYTIADGRLADFIRKRSNSPFLPYALLKRGILSFEKRDFENAEFYFGEAYLSANSSKIKRQDESYSEIAQYALYWKAVSIAARTDYFRSKPFFEQCVKDYPHNQMADDALYALGQINEINREYEEAIAAFKKIRIEYPKSNCYVAAQVREANNNLVLRNPAGALLRLEQAEAVLNSIALKDSIGLLYETQSFSNSAREEILYLRGEAGNILRNFDLAITYFTAFLETFTESDLFWHATLGLGWAQLNLAKYDLALENYDKVIYGAKIKDNKSIAIAQLYRVVALKAKGDKEQSRKELSGLALQSDYPFLGLVLLELGQLYYEDKDWDNARRTLERGDREAPDPLISTRILLVLGAVYIELEQWEKAINAYQKAEDMAKNSPEVFMPQKNFYLAEARLKKGLALINANRSSDAIISLNTFIAESPKDPRLEEALFWLAEAYYRNDLLANAAKSYQNLLDKFPNTPRREDALYGMGWSYFRQQNFKQSSSAFDKLVKEYPESKYAVEVLTRQADGFYLSKNYNAAASSYERVFKFKPNAEDGQYAGYQLAHAYYMGGKYEQSFSSLMDFVRRYPRSQYSANAMYLMGWIRFQQKRYQEAIDNYSYLIEAFPTSSFVARSHYSIADAYFNKEDYQNAKKKYQYVVESFPTSGFASDAMAGVQQCLVLLGREDEAIEIIRNYTQKNEDSPFVRQFREKGAGLMFENRKFKDAINEYEAIINQYPDNAKNAEAVFWIGKSYLSMGDDIEAEKAFLRLQKEYPKSNEAPLGMLETGLLAKKRANPKKADSVFAKLIELYPTHSAAPQAGFERGLMSFNQGDTMTSMKHYYFVANNFFNNQYSDNARYRIANYLRMKELNDSSRKEFRILAEVATNQEIQAECYYRIAELWKKDKNLDSAKIAFEIVKERYSNYEDWFSLSLLNLGEVYEDMKEYGKAEELYLALKELRANDDFGKTATSRLARVKKKKQ